jgi:hypothetical protein
MGALLDRARAAFGDAEPLKAASPKRFAGDSREGRRWSGSYIPRPWLEGGTILFSRR